MSDEHAAVHVALPIINTDDFAEAGRQIRTAAEAAPESA